MAKNKKTTKENLIKEVIRPVLSAIYMDSPRAREMLLGIAAVESDMGTFLRNYNGSDLGPWQINKQTYEDIVDRYLCRDDKQKLRHDIEKVICQKLDDVKFEDLETNFKLGCALARIRLWWVPERLPNVDDVQKMAIYWKEHYNTSLGKGKKEHFLEKYNKYVKGEG